MKKVVSRIYLGLVFLFLYAPILVLIAFSFNESKSRAYWTGFSMRWYVQLFQDCGWEYLFEFAGYSYFRKPAEEAQGDESIFCDDESRLEMVRRVFYGRMLPVLLIFICLILPQFADAVGQDEIASPFFILILILLALFLLVFCQFAWQYRRFSQGIHK